MESLVNSKRHKDDNGFLHVSISNISKEGVNPYYGYEIPNYKKHGLEGNKIYYAYRKGDELEKSSNSFNGLPLLRGHYIEHAENPQKEHRVGSLGTNAKFVKPYLQNALIVTDAEAIRKIESGERVELSAAYTYTPIFQKGEFEGQNYDFIMTEIKGNHVALVEEGRAGADVVVADSNIKELEIEKDSAEIKGEYIVENTGENTNEEDVKIEAEEKNINFSKKKLDNHSEKEYKQNIENEVGNGEEEKSDNLENRKEEKNYNLENREEELLNDNLNNNEKTNEEDKKELKKEIEINEQHTKIIEEISRVVQVILADLPSHIQRLALISKLIKEIMALDTLEIIEENQNITDDDKELNNENDLRKKELSQEIIRENLEKILKDKLENSENTCEDGLNKTLSKEVFHAMDSGTKLLLKREALENIRSLQEASQKCTPFTGELDILAFDSANHLYLKACNLLSIDADLHSAPYVINALNSKNQINSTSSNNNFKSRFSTI